MGCRVSLTLACLCFTIISGCGGGSGTPAVPPPVPDFSIAVQPTSLTLVEGTSRQIQVTQSPLHGFTGTISVNAGSLPAGITLSPGLPQNVSPSGLTLTVQAGNGSNGNYNFSFNAVSGTLQHTTTLRLTVGNRATLSIFTPSEPLHIAQGNHTSADITVNADSGIVDFDVQLQSSAPTGVATSFSKSVIAPNTTVGLTINAGNSAPLGPGTITVVAKRSVDGVQTSASFPINIDPKPGSIPGNRANWVRLGSNPIAIYYDSPRNHVLASLPNLNKVQVIDPVTGTVLSSIPVSVANYEPNGVWLASSSNLSATLDGKSLLVVGTGHVATIDLAKGTVVAQRPLPKVILPGWTTPTPINPTFLVSAKGGHTIFGSWGDSMFFNWDGVSPLASLHILSDLYSFDRNFDGSKVLVASGDTSGAYQLLDVNSDTIALERAYSDATIMTVRGNPTHNEWAVANSHGVDFLDANLNLIATVSAFFRGSGTYWGMTYSADGKFLYFVYSPGGLPFLVTVDDATHRVVRIAPATGTDLAYFLRVPQEWMPQPFAADNSGLVFALGNKGLVIDDSTYSVDPIQASSSDFAIIAAPDNGPLGGSTSVQIETQSFAAQPDVWFGAQRALAESIDQAGQVSAKTPPATSAGPVNIKLFPPDGYAHLMPQAFTYGTVIRSVRNSICRVEGGCSADIFGFGLFGSDSNNTNVTIGGNAAPVQSIHYFNADQPYPYPLQYVSVTVPPGLAGNADVTVQTAVGKATLGNGFVYAPSLQSYASSQTYNSLLFDQKRGILYASTNATIDRFSVSSSTFLTPLSPPSTTGQRQFQAMALTPDGSKLIVANKQDVSVAVIDPDNPAHAQAISVPGISTNMAGPVFVAATSTNKVLISVGGFSQPWVGSLYELDLGTLQVQALNISGTFFEDQPRLSSTADGSRILIRGYGRDIGIWDAASRQYSPVADGFAGSGLGTTAPDGSIFAVGLGFIDPDGTSTIGLGIPDELGGFQSIFPNDAALNETGSLQFVPDGTNLLIIDTHHGDVLRNMTLPYPTNVWAKVIALDSTAEHIFLSDSQGLTVLTLKSAPLSIGTVNPTAASTSGGTMIQIRGSGFQPTTTVTIGGKAASVQYLDTNTLQVTAPANPVGPTQIVVTGSKESYRLDAALDYR